MSGAPAARRRAPLARLGWVVATSAALGAGCAGRPALEARAPSAACRAQRASLLLLGFAEGAATDLDRRAAASIVVFAEDCGRFRVLDGCSAPGAYTTIGTTARATSVVLTTAEEVRWNAPSPPGAAPLRPAVARALTIAGRRTATRSAVRREELRGACAGATHFLRAIDLGALTALAQTPSCGHADDPTALPPAACAASVRLHLSPIGPAVVDELARAQPDLDCPDEAVAAEGRCVARAGAKHFQCRPGDGDECRSQCAAGDAGSCATLGWMLLTGRGVEPDFDAGLELERKACVAGVARACGNAAIALVQDVSSEEEAELVATLFRGACDAGDASSCVDLGQMLRSASGAPPPLARAMFERGCSGGESRGCTELGWLASPTGAAPDAARERAMHERACADGVGISCAAIAEIELRGDDPKAVAHARQILDRECSHGLDAACFDLGLLYQAGRSVEQDYVAAATLFEKACRADVAESCRTLGYLREHALGAPRDMAQAAGMYAKACSIGDATGCNDLGRMHLQGTGILKDETRAAELFGKACEAGEAVGCANLASLHDEGRGVPKSPERAVELHARACELGYAPSCRR